jgi:type I restriction enzyme S subunit
VSRKLTKLSAITEVITKGTTPTTLGYDFAEQGIPFLRVQNISEGTINYKTDTLFVDSKTQAALKRSQIQPGDVLVSIAGSIGRAGVVPDDAPPMNCNQAVAILRPTKEVHKPFLRLWIESTDAQRQISSSTVTGTISNLSLTHLGDLEIPLPPLPEQRRIAEVLDRAEALRAKRRAALAQLDSLTQAIFLEMFGDVEGKSQRFPCGVLDDFCCFLSGFAWKAERFSREPVGLPIIRIQNVDAVRDSDFIYWPDAYQERFVMRKGDLLLTLSGSFRIAEWTGPDALLNQRIVRIDAKPDTERIWLLHAVRLLVTKIEALGRHALVNNVALSDLKQLPLVRPPVELQREFARRVTTLEKLRTAHRSSLSELNTLFASLQHRAFRGEL